MTCFENNLNHHYGHQHKSALCLRHIGALIAHYYIQTGYIYEH